MTLTVTRADLKTYLRNNYFEKLDPVGVRRVERGIENGLRMVSRERNWAFLLDTYQFNTTDVYETGTVTVSVATVTGTATVFPPGSVGSFIELFGEQSWYMIKAVGGDTSLTLNSDYGGTGTGAAYKIIYPNYDLPINFRKYVTVKDRNQGTNLFNVEAPAAWWAHDEFAGTGTPRSYAIVQKHGDPNQKQILFYPPPSGTQSYELVYWRHVGWYDTATPATNNWKMRATLDSDYIDWPEEKLDLLYSAILLCLYRETEPQKEMGAYSMYQQLLTETKNDDNENGGIRTLSDGGAKPYQFPYSLPTS